MFTVLTQENVTIRIKELVKEHIGLDTDLSPQTHLRDDLEVDSLELVELGIKLEKIFGLTLPDAAVRRCVTLDDLTQLVLGTQQEGDVKNA